MAGALVGRIDRLTYRVTGARSEVQAYSAFHWDIHADCWVGKEEVGAGVSGAAILLILPTTRLRCGEFLLAASLPLLYF